MNEFGHGSRSLGSFGPAVEGGSDTALSLALNDFRRARNRAAMKAVLSRLRGTSLELLSFAEITDRLHVTGQVDRGVHDIPLDKIIGSVGRYQDFDRSFLPLNKSDAQRWAGLLAAAPDPTTLPPIEVYQIGDAYFVIDGNHRVSIARLSGIDFLAAHVIEVKTRVPLPADLDHHELILASEKAAFLEHTRLDKLRPTADLATSLVGQYDKLENHIEVHRFFIEQDEDRALADEEAALHWYDEAYLPVVEAIREYGLLRGFPGRTETDLYLWIAENQAALSNEVGWEVSPQAAAARVAPRFDPAAEGRLSRLYRKALRAVVPERKDKTSAQWLEQKTLDRYSDRLFASILVIVSADQPDSAVAHAANVAQLEQAHLLAVRLGDDPPDARRRAREQFTDTMQQAGLSGEIGFARDDLLEVVKQYLPLADLVVLDQRLISQSSGPRLVEAGNRPILLVHGPPSTVGRVLFICDSRAQAEEALFVAAYMAEMWGCRLVMVVDTVTETAVLDSAQQYLELHETSAAEIVSRPLTPEAIFQTAVEYDCDLIVVGGYRKAPLSKLLLTNWLAEHEQALSRPLLICP